ncbi:50S ribosomal protein L21 [Patescibacteria group bacterium]|nr:50S ribosomal protein L21 [Patescibacteria group bacterium]
MFAVIKTGGKQYIVQEGDVITVEKLEAEVGGPVSFEVMLLSDEEGKDMKLGTPLLSTKATGEVVEHGRGKKIEVVKYKAKTRYKKRVGHRQPFTKVKISKLA